MFIGIYKASIRASNFIRCRHRFVFMRAVPSRSMSTDLRYLTESQTKCISRPCRRPRFLFAHGQRTPETNVVRFRRGRSACRHYRHGVSAFCRRVIGSIIIIIITIGRNQFVFDAPPPLFAALGKNMSKYERRSCLCSVVGRGERFGTREK